MLATMDVDVAIDVDVAFHVTVMVTASIVIVMFLVMVFMSVVIVSIRCRHRRGCNDCDYGCDYSFHVIAFASNALSVAATSAALGSPDPALPCLALCYTLQLHPNCIGTLQRNKAGLAWETKRPASNLRLTRDQGTPLALDCQLASG
jgi:hypothetical protein